MAVNKIQKISITHSHPKALEMQKCYQKETVQLLSLIHICPRDMPDKLRQIRERIGKYEGDQRRMEETGEDQILETDPECLTLRTKE